MLKKGKYRHYKGQDYLVKGVVLDTETKEPMVLYSALYEVGEYDQDLFGEVLNFVRPLSLFVEKVEINGKTISRFECIEN